MSFIFIVNAVGSSRAIVGAIEIAAELKAMYLEWLVVLCLTMSEKEGFSLVRALDSLP